MFNINNGDYVPPMYNNIQPPAQYGFFPGQQQEYAGSQHNAGPPVQGGQQQTYFGGPQQPFQQYNAGGFQQNYGAPPGAIFTQPGAHMQPGQPGEWMSIPAGIPNCPRGLEYLASIDQLIVGQKVEAIEIFTGFENNNKYTVRNSLGQKVYFAIEDSDCCTRNICGSSRPFEMKIFDNFRNEVMHINRPLACSCCLFPCCLQNMEITAPPGNVIGTIEQEWSLCKPAFKVKNHLGDPVLSIEGPVCPISMCGDVNFDILSLTGGNIGGISKKWGGAAREFFSGADSFGITFPMDLDVRMKAVLLGATFLIDFMYFEKSN